MGYPTETSTRVVLAMLCICAASYAHAGAPAAMHAAGCAVGAARTLPGAQAASAVQASSARASCRGHRHDGNIARDRHVPHVPHVRHIAPGGDAPAGSVAPARGAEALTVTAASEAAASGFALQAGQSLQAQLQRWARDAGWTVVWTSPDDWIVPGAGPSGGAFADAAREVIEALAQDGADIRGDLYLGNHTLVVHVAGEDE